LGRPDDNLLARAHAPVPCQVAIGLWFALGRDGRQASPTGRSEKLADRGCSTERGGRGHSAASKLSSVPCCARSRGMGKRLTSKRNSVALPALSFPRRS